MSNGVSYSLIVVLLLAGLTGTGAYFADQYEQERIATIISREESKLTAIQTNTTQRLNLGAAAFTALVTEIERILEFEELSDAPKNHAITDALKSAMASKLNYDHIRILSPKGIETVGFYRLDQKITRVPNAELEDKSSRDYFQRALRLESGQMLVDVAALNIENGELDPRMIPITRGMQWLHNQDGSRFGLLIASVAYDDWLSPLKQSFHNPPTNEMFIVTASGMIQTGGERYKALEFAADKGITNGGLDDINPALWSAMQLVPSGTYNDDSGLYIFGMTADYHEFRPNREPLKGPRAIIYLSNESLYGASAIRTPEFYVAATVFYVALIAVAVLYWRNLRSKDELIQQKEEISAFNTKLATQSARQRNMFSIISHELRTPASAIHMLADELNMGKAKRSELQSVTQHLLSVIDDLRTTVNPDTDVEPHPAPFELATLTQEVERQTATLTTSNGFALEISYTRGVVQPLLSDAYRLRAILINLIRNSVFHSGGARIWLSAEAVQKGTEWLLTLRVEDDGEGIPLDQLDRLLDPFERGETQAEGTGVGLYLVKNWTEKLGGHVSYSRSVHGGACFTITLKVPGAQPEDQEDVEAAHLLEAKALIQGRRVLLVEDDAILRRATTRALKNHFGADVVVAEDGKQALALLEKETVDLIVTDYFMPNLNGRELILELRGQGRTPPMIALTAATIGQEQDELKDAGADVVLPKPLDVYLFAQAVRGFEARGTLWQRQTGA